MAAPRPDYPAAHTAEGRKADAANYRPEVEGVRAVASLLVAIFHIWLGRVSGGVDVFFVVAGYLTTATLLGHINRYGRIQVGRFLSRLASRLLPASAVVLVVVFIASFAFLLPSQRKQTFAEILASAFYVQNWQLARSGVDYLTQDDFHSPVQNFWAMSVQGQFYLIWALIFVTVGVLARYLITLEARRLLVAALAVVVVASFAYATCAVTQNQSTAYYNTFARAWEFGLGGLAAIILPGLLINARLRMWAGWIGLAGMLSCGFVLQVSLLFPGAAALWPTVSVLLILIAGSGVHAAFGAERLLSTRPLVWLGGISYGLYLWHWPILVFVTEVTGERPGLGAGLAIIAAAIGLATLSKRYIEDPLHRRIPGPIAAPTRRRTLIPVAMIAVAAVIGGVGVLETGRASASDISRSHRVADAAGECVGAAALATGAECADSASWTSSIPTIDASDDGSGIDTAECSTTSGGVELKECVFGVSGGTRVVLIGNSHAASYAPAVRVVADDLGWELHVFYKTGCVFNSAARKDDTEQARSSCNRWNDKLDRELAAQQPYDYVITGYSAKKSRFVDDTGAVDPQAGVDGFRESWQPLIARGAEVMALVDNPVMDTIEQGRCAERAGDAESCRIPIDSAFAARDLIREAATDFEGAVAADFTDFYCTDAGCPLVVGGVKVYRDRGHITGTYMRTLAPYLAPEFERALGHPLSEVVDADR